jgi:hypothetical protein
MPLTLATRIGPDTLGKLEQAATRRYAEASRLVDREPLGAIYLFGYTAEMRLKAAYYRTVGLVPASPLAPIRTLAEAQIRTRRGIRGAVGHNLYGWAELLEFTRATTPGATPLPIGLAGQMYLHVQNMEACWTEVLRYRANKPYNEEIEAVRVAARWFRVNARRLWS